MSERYIHKMNWEERARRAEMLLGKSNNALVRVMSWIDNWSPSFKEDDEWTADDQEAREAIDASTSQLTDIEMLDS